MNNNYENKILDAIQTLVDSAVSNAGYDKTIKAVISKCVNQNTGKYVVRYQDSSFYAYSNDLDSIYTGGTPVYVLVPGNDMSQTKTILGSVDKLGTEYISLSESSSAYQEVGTSIVTPNGTIPGISSYKKNIITNTQEDSVTIYNREDISHSTVTVDTEGAEIYFQNAQYIEIGGTFTTRLNEEQKRRGNYGLVFDMDFKNGEDIVNKKYVIDINSMTGNPYSYNYGSAQTAIFQIDGANFYRLNSITLECKNFPHTATPANADIFVEDIVLKALTPLTRDEIANNSLTFITQQGIYFSDNDSVDATRLIETEVKINKKVVPNTGGLLRFYWFKEDSTVGITSPDYLPFGGPGWKCINTYNVIDETNDIRDYITDVDTLTVAKDKTETAETGVHPEWHNLAKENEYKCVVIYNNEIQVERNIIIYNQASEYTITIESDQGNYFKYNEGNPTLTCSVDPVGTYTYIWTETNSANRTEVLTETSNTYSIQLSNIANFSKFTCSVYSSGNFVGKSDIVITNSWDSEDNSYALVMENGDQIFKYNEKGIAPTNKSLEKPIVLKPLQFILYDEMGHQVDDNKISALDVSWYVPKEDTMIKVTPTGITPVEEDGYLIYSGIKTLNFEIASIYNNKKMNNAIKLNVRYNDRVLNTTSELEFIKEGEIGSNGTDFVCRIVPNVAANAQVPNYPIYTYNTTTSTGAMNYQLAANNKWFKVQLYKDGVQIYEGVASGTSEESKAVTVAWSMLTNKYSSTVSDTTSFNVNSSTGEFSYVNLSDANLDRAANITKVTVTYDGATYYATMPIILVRVSNASYKLDLENNTGFRYVMYTTDGLNPVYDSSNPFALIAYNGTTDITNNNSITFTYSTLGQTYNGITWVNENNFITKTHGASNPLAKNEADYRPIEKFNGLSVNNAVKCIVKNNNVEIVRAYLPIHFYLNRFGNAALNGWDGNHIEINNNGGFILAPQVGAGKKESDNSYTGIFMGNVREAGSSVDEVGLYGYYKGTRTIALDTKDGSARFGKQGAGQIVIDPASADYSGKGTARLYSNDYSITYTAPSDMVPAQTKYTAGFSYWRKVSSTEYRLLREGTDYTIGNTIANTDYVWDGGAGLEIDLNDPHIRFGSGKFRVDSDGQVYATGFVTVNNLENGDYNIPSASIDVGGGDSLNDYMSATEQTLESLQNQIDGEIQFWNGSAIPTLNNYPASDWYVEGDPVATENLRLKHQADIYTVIQDVQGELKQGKSYRFDKVSGVWQWIELTDQEMSAVQALAASKAKVFIKDNLHPNPTPPYSVGDIWLADGDMYTCINAKDNTGSYAAADWELATDYTDDSAVNTLKQNVISSSEVQYALGNDATIAPTTGWSASTPTWTTGKYVWQRTVVTYADSTQTVPHTDISDPVCIQGAKGEPGSGGRGIASTEIKYQASNSGTTAPTGTWQTNVPSISPGQFLWTRTVITYTDGLNPTTSYSVSYDGTNGTNGTSITITTQNVTYAESTSGTTAPTTGWQSSIPNVDDGKFLWTKTYVKYSDNTETTSYSVSYQSVDGYTLWTYPSDPSASSGTYTFTRSSMVGPSQVAPQVGEFIYGPQYRYTIATVTSTTVTATVRTDLKGETGISATNVVCGNEAQIISCDKDGKVEANTTITIPFAGYIGSARAACSVAVTDLPDGISVTSNTSATGGSSGADGSLVLTATANKTLGGNSSGTITLTFSCNSLTFVKKFAWSKAIKGATGSDGKDAYTVILSNESHTFAASETAATGETLTVTPYVYKGATQITNYTIGTISGTVTGLTAAATRETSSDPYVISIEATTDLTTASGVLTIPILADGKTFNKQFSWSLAKKGADGTSPTAYSLIVSHAAIVKAQAGTYNPTSITFSATSQTGNAAIATYTGGSYRITKDGGTAGAWADIAASNSYNVTNNAPTTSVKIELAKENASSGTHTIVDAQTIPIVKDGKGISSITNYYLATSASSGVTRDTSGWTTSVQSMTETNKYLWNYEDILYNDNSHTYSDPSIIGVYGETGAAGKGISAIDEYYAINNSSTTAPADSDFSTTIVSPTESNPYLWNYEKITYVNPSGTENTAKHVIGHFGINGTSPYIAYLTNEAQTFASGTAATATTQLYAYQGTTEKSISFVSIGTYTFTSSTAINTNYDTGKANMQFSVDAKSGTHPTISFKASSSLAQSVTEQIPIVYKIADENVNRTIYFSYSSTKTGGSGADAKLVTVNPSSQVFKSTEGASGTFTPQYIYLYPYFQGGATYSKWQYSTNGTTWTNVTSGSNSLTIGTYNSVANTLRIERTCNLYTNSVTAISFKCVSDTASIYDTVTVTKIYDVTELEIGGRNYVSNSVANWQSGNWSIPSVGDETSIVAYANRISLITPIEVEPSTDYWIKVTSTKSNIKALFRVCDSDDKFIRSDTNLSNQKWTSGANDKFLHLTIYDNSSLSDIADGTTKIKLEKGNISTDWTMSQEDIEATYDLAQSVTITYTTTDTSDTPGDSANWVNILPSAPDKYIWQKTLYSYLDDSRNNSVVTCIYTPTRITNELEYCLCSDRNYSDANRTNPWRSEPYPWDDSYFAASGIGDITILRYQFVRNRYTDINKTTDADSYSTPILDQSWYMFGLKIASEKVAREALENNINNNIIKMDAQTGLTVSSADNLNGIRLTNWGIQFLSGNDWVTVWDIKGNLDASLINVTHLKAEDILSGTLTLDPAINDGKFYLSGTQGSNTTIDGDGVKVTDVDGNTVHLQATSSGGISAKTSANEEYFKIRPGTKETTMTNGQVDNNLGLGNNIKIVQTTHGIAFIGIYEPSS